MSLILREPTLMDTALCAMNLIEEDREQWYEFTGQPYDADDVAVRCWNFQGMKWAICDETNMALAVAGLCRVRPGVYQTWFLSGHELWTHGKKVTEVTSKVARMVLAEDAHRIETICLAKRKETRSWYEKCGLHFEAEFPNYGVSGANAVQYAVYRTPELT